MVGPVCEYEMSKKKRKNVPSVHPLSSPAQLPSLFRASMNPASSLNILNGLSNALLLKWLITAWGLLRCCANTETAKSSSDYYFIIDHRRTHRECNLLGKQRKLSISGVTIKERPDQTYTHSPMFSKHSPNEHRQRPTRYLHRPMTNPLELHNPRATRAFSQRSV